VAAAISIGIMDEGTTINVPNLFGTGGSTRGEGGGIVMVDGVVVSGSGAGSVAGSRSSRSVADWQVGSMMYGTEVVGSTVMASGGGSRDMAQGFSGTSPGSPNDPRDGNRRIEVTTDRPPSPHNGPPNTTVRQVDANGRTIMERHFGPDGRSTWDIHHTHHGNPGTHPHVPHKQFWDWSVPAHPKLGPDFPLR